MEVDSGGYLPSRRGDFICDNIPTKAILFFVCCTEVNSTWLITSKLANQRARKVLFTCVVYTNRFYLEPREEEGKRIKGDSTRSSSNKWTKTKLFTLYCKLLSNCFKVHLTTTYFFRSNKSLHLFETHCAFLPVLTQILTFYTL